MNLWAMSMWVVRQRWLARLGCSVVLVAVASVGHAHNSPLRAAGAPVTDPAEIERRSQSVASFAGGTVTLGELEDAILEQNPLMQERYKSMDAVHALLDRSVRFALLAVEAERRGYDKSPPAVLAANQAAVQHFIQHEFDDAITPESIPEPDVQQYYAAHIDEFVRGEGRRASVAFLADQATAEALSLKVQGLDMRSFRDLVRAQSLDETTKQRGGDLPFFDAAGKGFEAQDTAIDPAVAKAAFALKEVGDTSRPIQVGERFAVVRLSGIRAAEDDSLRAAADRIRQRLWRDRRQAAIDVRVEQLKQEHHYSVHRELIDAVKLDSGPPLPPSDGLPGGFPHTPEIHPQKTSRVDTDPR